MKIKHYTKRVSRVVKRLYRDELGIKLGWFATYADILDELWKKGYWVELCPFHTFSFADRLGVIYKLYFRDENDCWKCVYDEEKDWSSDEGFGSSFDYAMAEMTVRLIKKYIEDIENDNTIHNK